jgi:uncharacterized protein (DUF362 family)
MSDCNRRAFLQTAAAAGVFGLGGAGCSQGGPPAESTAEAGPAMHVPPPDDGGPQMSIARWTGSPARPEDDLRSIADALTRKAVEEMGGLKRFVRRGDTVWIKPNIAIHAVEKFAANTNPQVVATLCRLAMDAGAGKVKVGDSSAYGAGNAYPMSGIEAAVNEVGAEMVYLDPNRFEKRRIRGEFLDEWPVYPDMVDADVLINVPILKHHALATITIGMKNLMGVAGGDRSLWHKQIDICLADITVFARARLHIMDAVRMLVRHGPKGGDMKDVKFGGLVAASTDVVALDSLGAEMLGFKPSSIKTLQAGVRRGLGTFDYRSLRLRETGVA